MKSFALGVHLGSAESVVAYCKEGEGTPAIVTGAEGHPTTPTVVALDERDGSIAIGHRAWRLGTDSPDRLARFFVDHLGEDYRYRLGELEFSATDLCGLVLTELRGCAEASLGNPVREAVVCCRSWASCDERHALVEAAGRAGLEVLQLVPDFVAAAHAYGVEFVPGAGMVLVYHLGATSFLASVLRCGDGSIEVVASAGERHLGALDWDNAVAQWLADQLARAAPGTDADPDSVWQTLLEEARQMQLNSDGSETSAASLACVGGPDRVSLTTGRLQELTGHYLDMTIALCDEALSRAGVPWDQLRCVIQMGDVMPAAVVRAALRDKVGDRLLSGVDTRLAAAMGAALLARRIMARSSRRLAISMPVFDDDLQRVVLRPLIPADMPTPCEVNLQLGTRDPSSATRIQLYQAEEGEVDPDTATLIAELVIPNESVILPRPLVITVGLDTEGSLVAHATERLTGEPADLVVVPVAGPAAAAIGQPSAHGSPCRSGRGEAAATSPTGPPQLVDAIEVGPGAQRARIELCVGDITALSVEQASDVLVVSAFPDDYAPLPGTLIEALRRRGVYLEQLAREKEVDLRQAFSCWLSREVSPEGPSVNFGRILCFEPYYRGTPAEQIGDIFRSLAPFVGGNPSIRSVATPLVASGYQMVPPTQVLKLLVEAALQWMTVGLPLRCMRIACLPGENIEELRRVFSELKEHYQTESRPPQRVHRYDIFVSYAHADAEEAMWLVTELHKRDSNLRLFVDRLQLDPGAAWQREIYEALDDSRQVLPLFSPAYVVSKVCQEEYNIAHFRQRETGESILVPIYLYSADLPTYMKLVQYADCREFNQDALRHAIGARLRGR